MGLLAGKVALVTGAARGIGRGIAERMTSEGAIVITADISAPARNDHSAVLDVTSETSWNSLADMISSTHGRLDVLVNNAGIDFAEAATSTTLENWRRVMAVNLDGTFLGCRTMHPLLAVAARDRPSGAAIINISSSVGIAAMAGRAAYGSSKAGVRHLTKLLAIEWSAPDQNIRVNSIHPGTIRTEMFEESARGLARQMNPAGTLEDGLAAIASMIPQRRIGRIEDVAHAAIYLASDSAAYVTGTELVVDGGHLAT